MKLTFIALLSSTLIVLSACSKESSAPAAPKKIPELASIQLQPQTNAQEVKYDGVIEAINQALCRHKLPVELSKFPWMWAIMLPKAI